MSLLRIYASITDAPQHCRWVLTRDDLTSLNGEGRIGDLPQDAERVQLVIPATQVHIVRAKLPGKLRRATSTVLAFAIEEKVLSDPEDTEVIRLGFADDEKEEVCLAVVDKTALTLWRTLLAEAGISEFDLCCETLMLPRKSGEWSIAWDGSEGFVRTGKYEGNSTDRGGVAIPPLSLNLLIDEARAQNNVPNSVALYVANEKSEPDIAAWQSNLGIPVRVAGPWTWLDLPNDTDEVLMRSGNRWHTLVSLAPRFRPAISMLCFALVFHVCALIVDSALMSNEQRNLRNSMASQFRTLFPDAVAIVDPALQMRRKLAEKRHQAGQQDDGDFLPMLERVSEEIRNLPIGSVYAISYESGHIIFDISAANASAIDDILLRLRRAGFSCEVASGLKSSDLSRRTAPDDSPTLPLSVRLL